MNGFALITTEYIIILILFSNSIKEKKTTKKTDTNLSGTYMNQNFQSSGNFLNQLLIRNLG